MAAKDDYTLLTAKDLAQTFADPAWAMKFPPFLTVDQAAELLQVPKGTIYDWSSRGLLVGCARKVGKHLRIYRDKFLLFTFNKRINHHAR